MLCDFSYLWNLKIKTNEQTAQKKCIDTENRWVVAREEGLEGGQNGWKRIKGSNFQLQNK